MLLIFVIRDSVRQTVVSSILAGHTIEFYTALALK